MSKTGTATRDEVSGRSLVQLSYRPDTLTLSVYTTIRQAIIDGALPADARVTEAGLATQLQVSKTPVREALLRLKEIGLIESDGPRVGRIVSPSRAHIRDAYDIRESLEATSARLAAERGSEEALLTAKRMARKTLEAANDGDLVAYRIADEAFHSAVAAASDNSRLSQLIDNINGLVSALRQRDIPGVDGSVMCAEQHMGIVGALLDRDADRASTLMVEHVRNVASEVLAYFD